MKCDLSFPKDWSELSDKLLKYVYKLIASEYSVEQICIFCLFRWNNISVLARNAKGDYLVSRKKKGQKAQVFEVSSLKLAELMPLLKWIAFIPQLPVRVSKLGFHKGVEADFNEVPFGKFVMVDNLYQGYLATRDESILDQIASVVYDYDKPLRPWMRVNIFYWISALKNLLAVKFPDFFQPADLAESEQLNPNSVEDAMNAMIRALTKGDITKEKYVLEMDTWRALSELNSQAKEYRELNAKLKNK